MTWTLILYNENGDLIREYESEAPWSVHFNATTSNSAVMVCRGLGVVVYPSDGVTVEIRSPVMEPVP